MWTRWTRPTLAALAAIALWACGGGEGEPEGAPSDAPSQTVFGGQRPGGETPAPAAQATTPGVPFRDATPEEALATYLDRLAAGDLPGAVEICDPTVPGTEALEKQAANLTKAAADTGMTETAIAGLVTQGFADATHEETAREEDRVTFLVITPGKRGQECVVVRTPDGWRVQPPASGMPNG